MIGLVAAQSNPATRANQQDALSGLPAEMIAHLGANSQVPPAHFGKAVGYVSGGSSAWSVAIGDVNGDGHPDLVVASYCQSLDHF